MATTDGTAALRQPGRGVPQAADACGMRGMDESRPARVLVVEDDLVQADLLKVLLSAAGYEVVHVVGPVGFRRAVMSIAVDLVLLDVALGRANGLDTLADLAPDLRAPVIALTAYPQWMLDRDKRSALLWKVLLRPVEPAVLLAHVRSALAGTS